MLLTITTTQTPSAPASDLGFLLHKHPDRAQRFEQSFGTAHVFYPEAGDERCTAALLLEVDPQALLRTRTSVSTPDFALAQYVNDRPYATSSLFTAALGRVMRTALRGRCEQRPELARTPLPLELHLPAVPCRPGPERARALFEPLGWTVRAEPVPLDPGLPGWGDSHYLSLTLTGTLRLSEALNHLYVLLPAMDGGRKHYWVDETEVDKLLRAGGVAEAAGEEPEEPAEEPGWLATHPERSWITRRFLDRRQRYVRTALGRLQEAESVLPAEAEDDPAVEERAPDLAEQRIGAVLSVLRSEQADSVVDLGCGSGALLTHLVREPALRRITGADVSTGALARVRESRAELLVGSVVHRDPRFRGHDAAVLMEVIEHLDPSRLPAMEEVVFGDAAPRVAVVTTPNAEYNTHYEGLAEGAFRHSDHRFEWTRAEFGAWSDRVARTHGYTVRRLPVGPDHRDTGAPTQLAVFTRHDPEEGAGS
ncbi:3' terminal RNA ribose 2'-O-methyltransferase Hen1 [Nocardiopsis sp. HNM0947]|uniref:Small RNA 2'-O-methyltransferase n=1 Tax=Nocardiopsis coralli TaxID=2772213 RepID=A0ABR9P5R6_9ACTN|nr:3' terminal RNA ribose 2'-O-methyltransferase Hen1 [Nocardiopsis coralli]MBE2999184.1 3' terminal RNA ribose 2'-O-methyltransferase Hen1 [Nocardiopsis coralli]